MGATLLVEGPDTLKAGLAALLGPQPGLEIACPADSEELPAPDLILLDLTMPGRNGLRNGIRLLEALKHRHPGARVLVLALHTRDEYVRDVLRAGADGFVIHSASGEELRTAVLSGLRGKTYLSPEVSGGVIHGYLGPEPAAPGSRTRESLTPRQRQILQLVAMGCTTQDIAQRLSLSVKAVRRHRSNLMRRLDPGTSL